ncbi:cytochrome P450 [Zopfia rhizophila CBS 207.26]|uniref:Cytochrome P450 n=1 Tax=Zopfia rhizophila CBS 207.26 TaxID=1314779 RepID=A0A6A6DER5_9PEZI|nr:cytochrome P450 [Zopfia rhizophila CBS 207.26]
MASILLGLWVVVALGFAWTGYSGYCLYINYLQACEMGIPIRIIPIDHLNKMWLLVDKQIVSLVRRLPGVLGKNNLTRFNYRGWHEHDRMRAHDEMGDAFVLVTPSHNWLYIADPDALISMYRRGKDFPRWVEITKMLDVFGGPNIATASGEQWRTHRKVVQSSLNERCNALVWSEAASLGDQMARHWASKRMFTSVGEDVRTVSLNILCKACFGQSYAFQGHNDSVPTSPSASFRFSLLTIMENVLLILALRPRFFTEPWLPLPNAWRELSKACITFREHMANFYNQKRRLLNENKLAGDSTLIASLARASQNKEEGKSLTESEVYGTMFVVSFAGHDTTAHLITFAIFYLAANSFVQDWLSNELRRVLGHRPPQEWNYHSDFPQLKRCMAILYETLRVKTLVPEVKWTSDRPQSLDIKGRTLTIPPETLVIPSYIHVHNNPRIWGADAQEWRPARWIAGSRTKKSISIHPSSCTLSQRRDGPELKSNLYDDYEEEVLLSPPSRGSYLGWSEGTRDCPGKRFSQVEWVAIMAALFRDWKVEPRRQGNETFTEARTRVLNFIDKNTDYGGLLLQLMHPESLPLVWSSTC